MRVRGTSVAAEDTADGVALTFVTTGDAVRLRKDVRMLAATYVRTGIAAGAEDVDDGALIMLTPATPDRLATLRALIHKRAAYMARGQCDIP